MKRFATKTLVMTAALAAFAVGASAQSMTAEIPFNFRAGDAVLTAGSYRINVSSGNVSVVQLRNVETKKSTMMIARYRTDTRKKPGGDPTLSFACTGSRCMLTSLWNGVDSTALVMGAPGSRDKEIAETRVVNVSFAKGE